MKQLLVLMVVGLLASPAFAGHPDESVAPQCVFQMSGARPMPCVIDEAAPRNNPRGPWCAEVPKEFGYSVYQDIVDKIADRCHLATAGREWEWVDGAYVKPFVNDYGSLIIFSLREHLVMAVKVANAPIPQRRR